MSEHHKYFQKLLEATELEYDSELIDHESYINSTELKDRVKEGHSLFPLVYNRSNFTYGDQLVVEFENTKFNIPRSGFKNGAVVEIFDLEDNSIQGIIKGYPKRNMLKVVIKEQDLPDWMEKGKLGMNLLPDTKTFEVIKWALDKIENAKSTERVSKLRDVILGLKSEEEKNPLSILDGLTIPELNPSQLNAVKQAQLSKEIAVLHGPPGTGKTTTIVQIIKQLLKNGEKILVTAPSNMAVDWLSEKLINEKITLIRLGNPVRVSNSIIDNTLESKVTNHPESKLIKKWRSEYQTTIKKAKQYKRSFDEDARLERKQLFAEAKKLRESIQTTEKLIIDQIISSADVISCTLTGAGDRLLNKYHFGTAIVDEAAQSLEPLSWIVALKADKILLAGDPCQLPATVKNPKAIRLGLDKSLLEKCIDNGIDASFLDTQYRMNEPIMNFSNSYFYKEKLKAHSSNAQHSIPNFEQFLFFDTAGTGMNELVSDTKGKSNPEEASLLLKFLKIQLGKIEADSDQFLSIGILSPYSDQVALLKELVETDSTLKAIKGLRVNTIDSFQGQEKDIIFISLVRSNEKSEIGFLKDYRRMNVAMTRARKSLVIFGDSATISNDNFYNQLIQYSESINAYRSAWELLY